MGKSEHSPTPGAAEPGKAYEPDRDDTTTSEATARPRSAPAPGVPLSDDVYKRLKEDAASRRSGANVPAQEDPANSR